MAFSLHVSGMRSSIVGPRAKHRNLASGETLVIVFEV